MVKYQLKMIDRWDKYLSQSCWNNFITLRWDVKSRSIDWVESTLRWVVKSINRQDHLTKSGLSCDYTEMRCWLFMFRWNEIIHCDKIIKLTQDCLTELRVPWDEMLTRDCLAELRSIFCSCGHLQRCRNPSSETSDSLKSNTLRFSCNT